MNYVAVIKLYKNLEKFTGEDDRIEILPPTENRDFIIGIAYNYEKEQYRIAAISFIGIRVSPVYYYDINKKELNNLNITDVEDLIDMTLMHPPLRFTYGNYDSQIKIAPNKRIWGIVNLILVESVSYFGDEPYLNGHTAVIDLDKFNADIAEGMGRLKIVSMVEDNDGNIKNVADYKIHAMQTLEEREEYIREHYEELISKID